MRNAAIQGIGLLIVCSSAAFGELGDELVGLSLEELMDVEVSLTSRKEQRRSKSSWSVATCSPPIMPSLSASLSIRCRRAPNAGCPPGYPGSFKRRIPASTTEWEKAICHLSM